MPTIAPESPLTPDLSLLMRRHTDAMHSQSPPGSIHMLDASKLAAPGIWFFVMRDGAEPVVTHIDARAFDGSDVDRATCITALQRRGR